MKKWYEIPGWFDFQDIYSRVVDEFSGGVSKLQLRAGSWCWNDSGALDYLQWMRLYPPDEHLVEVSAEVRRIPAWRNGPCRLFPMVVWDIIP